MTRIGALLAVACLAAVSPIQGQQRLSWAADLGMSYGSARVGSLSYGDFVGERIAVSFRANLGSVWLFDEFANESEQAARRQTPKCGSGASLTCLSNLPLITQSTALFGALVKRRTFEGRVAVGTGGILARDDAQFHGLAYSALLDGVWFLQPRVGIGFAGQRAMLPRSPAQSLFLDQLRLMVRYRWGD